MLLNEPFSKETHKHFWQAYDALPEQLKVKLLRITARKRNDMIAELMKRAKFPGGTTKPKVISRSANYGRIIDSYLKSDKDPKFIAQMLINYISETELGENICENIRDRKQDSNRREWLSKFAAECTDPSKRLVATFFAAYADLDSDAYDAPVDELNGEESDKEANAISFDGLDDAATEIETIAESIRNGLKPDQVGWSDAVERACSQLEEFRAEVSELGLAAGVEAPEWETRDELETVLRELHEAAEKQENSLVDFLIELAQSIRQLAPRHNLERQRRKLSELRDSSAGELESAAECEGPKWNTEGPTIACEWLKWAKELKDEPLESLLNSLESDGYGKTSNLLVELNDRFEIKEAEPLQSDEEKPFGDKPKSGSQKKNLNKTKKKPGGKENPKVSDKSAAGREPEKKTKQPQNKRETNAAARPDTSMHKDENSPQNTGSKSEIESDDIMQGANVEDEVSKPSTESNNLPKNRTDLAVTVLHSEDGGAIESGIEKIIITLLLDKETQIAANLARNAFDIGLTKAFPLPPDPLEILAILPYYSSGDPEVIQNIRQHLSSKDSQEYFSQNEDKDNLSKNILLAACALRPALFDPLSGAANLLEQLHLGAIGKIHDIASGLVNFARTNITLNATILDATLNVSDWEQTDEALRQQVVTFQTEAPKRTTNYAPGTKLWKHWFTDNGHLHRLFTLAASDKPEKLKEVESALAEFEEDKFINTSWNEIRDQGRLEGSALNQLRRLLADATALLQRRLDHWRSKSNQGSDFRMQEVTRLAEIIESNFDDAIENLRSVARQDEEKPSGVQAASVLLKRELNELRNELRGKFAKQKISAGPLYERQELLRIAGVDFEIDRHNRLSVAPTDAEDTPETNFSDFWMDEGRGRLKQMLSGLSQQLLNWTQSFERALERHDHRVAEWIISGTAMIEMDDGEELLNRRDDALENCIHEVRREITSAINHLESAFARGWVNVKAHEELSSRLEAYREKLDDSYAEKYQPYYLWIRDAKEIRRLIEEAKRKLIEQQKDKLSSIRGVDEADKKRIFDLLDEGNVHLAVELITQLEETGSVDWRDADPTGRALKEFLGDQGSGLYDHLNSSNFDQPATIKAFQTEPELWGFDLSGFQDRSESASAIQNWLSLAKTRGVDETKLKRLLSAFGFQVARLESGGPSQDRFIAKMEREIPCPVPDFGSSARKRLKILLRFGGSSVEDVFQSIYQVEQPTDATILLWFRPISHKERRRLKKLCHERKAKLLLIDSVLAFFALARDSQRLNTIFKCGLPFSNITPYTTSGGSLPQEMFFGRTEEIAAIETAASSGTSFVYGGRQIGKTVLLKKVERAFGKSSSGHIALYLDLNYYSVGQASAMDELWRIAATELQKREPSLFGKSISKQFSEDKFIEGIQSWLREDEGRRILLLLDEADKFLQADGESGFGENGAPFRMCTRMKGLMDKTDRRFKVVFAGLHNVQRSTKVANNPLAHLGTPVCVGPLKANGEAREAAKLVTQPLALAGIKFDSSNTVFEILARTNYYPNLIQILCQKLLERTIDRNVATKSKQTPPYSVSTKEVDRIFNDPTVRDDIRRKFELTLDLDKRFLLIANIIAWHRNEKLEGHSVDDIQREVMIWWPRGFALEKGRSKDDAREDLAALLREMCGLGILRRDENDRYHMRSPNVTALLGTPADIEHRLEAAAEWEPPVAYSPESFRAQTPQLENHLKWCSPLTARQETAIRDTARKITIIAGSKASGIYEVVNRLKKNLLGEEYIFDLSERAGKPEFEKRFDELTKRADSGKTVVLVPASVDWDKDWIELAKRRLGKFSAKDRAVGAIFVADTDRLGKLQSMWQELGNTDDTSVLRLRAWDEQAFRQWITDASLNHELIEPLKTASGGWHGIIREIVSVDNFGKTSIDEILKEKPDINLISWFGIDDPLTIKVLNVLAQLEEEASLSEILMLLDNDSINEHEVKKALTLTSSIGITSFTSPDCWDIDPFVAHILKTEKPVATE